MQQPLLPLPRVVIYTAQPFLAEGLRCALAPGSGFDFIAACGDADELVALLLDRRPEVALLDSTSITGPQLLARARATEPACRLVLWAEDLNVKTVRHAFDLGMSGVLSNRSTPGALLSALGRIARGELYFPDLYCTPGELAVDSLTPRQKQIAALLAQGLKNKEIAAALDLQEGTVKVYLSRIYRQLQVADRFELALLGLQAFFGAEAPGGGKGERAAENRLSVGHRGAAYPPERNAARC